MKLNNWIWSIYARIYDQLLDMPVYNELLQEVIDSLELDNALNLLDAGCGTGNLEQKILEQYFSLSIEAIDNSIQMLDIARKKTPQIVTIKQANLNKDLIYKPDSFDRIAAIHVIYALDEPVRVLRNFYKVLQPHGLLVIVNPRKKASVGKVMKANIPHLKIIERPWFFLKMSLVVILNLFITRGSEKGTFHFWEEVQWENALDEIGFSKVSIHATYGEQSYLIVAKKDLHQ